MSVNTRATLLERLRDGQDQLSWEEFFRSYWPAVYALARHRGCSGETAEEIVQDVMLKVFETRDVFQYDPARGRFRDWMATLVRNRVAERRRKPSERLRARGGSDEALPEPESDETQPDAECETAFEKALLLVLLDVVRREVDPRTYLAFELLSFDELPGREVARITGLSRNAAYKARKRVVKRLEELGGDYRADGRLHRRLKQAAEGRPGAVVERSVTRQIEKTMH
ncbi:MAG: sigma-70 family RNA polymerase sigma factor [Planctomycetes bacterium]|nr:sigma-70 family RNA polymerase sigma factor [Planctomycetota bacterium]